MNSKEESGASLSKACYKRICKEAEENQQVIPSSYSIERDNMICEREGMNPAIYAKRVGMEWIAFFEAEAEE